MTTALPSSRRRKAKFKVGQVVHYAGRNGDRTEKIDEIKEFEGEGFGYHFEGFYGGYYKDEETLRPLTAREFGKPSSRERRRR